MSVPLSDPGGSPRRLAIPAGLALVGSLLPWVLWAWYRFPAIGGSDPGAWEAAALGVSRGEPSPLAAAYPVLIAGLVDLLGIGWDTAGLAIAAACYAALGPVTWWLARLLGASPRLAGIAGLLALGEPWLALGSLQAQPDTLSALAFSLAVIAALAWVKQPDGRRLVPLLVAIALVPQVREHAPVVSAGLLVLLAVAPGGPKDRAVRLVLAGLLLLIVPTLLGEPLRLPWRQFWVQARWGQIFQDLGAHQAPAFLLGTPRGYQQAFLAAYAEHDRLRIAWLHASLNIHHGWTPWAWMGLGFVGWLLIGRRRWVAVAGLLPLLAVPVGAQQPRHVAVLVPIAAACGVAGMRVVGPWRLWLAAAVAVGLVGLGWAAPGQAIHEHFARGEQRLDLQARGAALCAWVEPDAVLIGGDPRLLVYCDLATAKPSEIAGIDAPLVWIGDLPRQKPDEWQDFQARGWAEIPVELEGVPLYHRPAHANRGP